MIEWKKNEILRGMQLPENKAFLVTDGKWVGQAAHFHERIVGYQWWDGEGRMLANITHYAEINLPKGEDK